MKIINFVFGALEERLMVKSKSEFSRRFLKRSANHFCIAEKRDVVSVETLLNLARSLSEHRQNDLRLKVLAELGLTGTEVLR